MNTSQSSKNLKKRAQALVEFALIVPVLMVILYGVIETGRYLFIYASTVTAARQATRYGTALGDSPNGTKYYNDCKGIEAAARKVQFLNKFQDVNIKYDGGLNPGTDTPKTVSPDTCPKGGSSAFIPVSGDRVIVEVTAQYTPILTLLPFKPFLVKSTSVRTILTQVAIFVPSKVPNQGEPVLSITDPALTPTPTYSAKDQWIAFSFKFTNNGVGSGDLKQPFTVDTVINGNTYTIECKTGAPTSLTVGQSFNCTEKFQYKTTLADMDAGSFTGYSIGRAKTPSGTILSSVGVPFTFTAIQKPSILLVSITPSPAKVSSVGAVITYTYTFMINNTSNVSIRGPYTITDDHASGFDCKDANAHLPLEPGSSTKLSCTGTHTVTQADIDNEILVNTATVTGIYGAGAGKKTPASNSLQSTVTTGQFFITVTADPSSSASEYGQVITYTYRIYNYSGGPITVSTVTHQNPGVISSDCNNMTVADNNYAQCTGKYKDKEGITTEYETLPSIDDTVYATRTVGTPSSTKPKSVSVSLVQVKQLTLSFVKKTTTWSETTQPANVGGTVTYEYSLKNDGNVTLAPPFTIDIGAPTAITTCSLSSLAPKYSIPCTVKYEPVTQADINAGSITKIATANATFGGTPISSNPVSTQVFTWNTPRFTAGVTADITIITRKGTTVTFTYTITNTGNSTLDTFSINSQFFGTGTVPNKKFSCGTGSLLPGAPPLKCTQFLVPTATVTETIKATANSGGTTVQNQTPATALYPSTVTVYYYVCNTNTLKITGPTYPSNNQTPNWQITNTVGRPLTLTSIKFTFTSTGTAYLNSASLSVNTTPKTAILPAITPISGSNKSGPNVEFSGSTFGPWTIPLTSSTPVVNFILNFSKAVTVSNLQFIFSEDNCFLPSTVLP